MSRVRLLAVAAVAATTLTGLVPATALAQGPDQSNQPGQGQGPEHRINPGGGGGTAEGLLCVLFHIRCNQ